jgi:hypothetical protein
LIRNASPYASALVSGSMRTPRSWPAIGQHASNSTISVDQNGKLITPWEDPQRLLELALRPSAQEQAVRIGDVVVL